ncbi:type II secretion system protein GspM [Lysobacter sp. GX 14042]|uniref:type II secretion system protein GspM n=1 Tax=Lysobacter sp. GX 14042 TaxID=2907155 RepID=UPI001F1D37A0|nr:type II secretion system protein GspM [Lysobacter sp. GX 14042]MCE7032751.1 type II secretion system protein GspM [Lysobacter sp. GX 14042]
MATALAERLRGQDRWVALALLLALLALVYALLVHPLWTRPMLEAGERIDGLRERELRLRMREQQAPQLRERMAELARRQGDRPGFLLAATPELATAGLVQRLEAVVSEASPGNRSCAISNRSPLQPDTRGEYVRVAVQVRLSCGTPELAAVLHALEGGSPRLFVDNLGILAQRMYGAGGAANDSGGLDVAFDLSGYLLASGEGGDAP